MRKLLLLLLLAFLLPDMALSQGKADMIQLEKPFAKLNKAKGWSRKNNSARWVAQSNKIRDLDHFTSYEWGTAEYRGQKYLYLRKYWLMGEYAIEADGNMDIWRHNLSEWVYTDKDKMVQSYVYLFDVEDYKSLINKMTEGENTLEIPALLINYEVKGENTVAAKIIENTSDTFVFRLLTDKKAKVGRFLFFDTVAGRVNPYSFRDDFMDNKLAFDLMENDQELFLSSELFERYFYEVTYKQLVNFLEAPLKVDFNK